MSANLFSLALAKNLRTAGIWGTLPVVWRRLFTCKFFSHLAKLPLADVCSEPLLFSVAQNRGKFALYCLSLQLLQLLCKAAHRGKSGGTGGDLAPVDAANQILCSFNSFHPLSWNPFFSLTPFVIRVYIPQAALPTFGKGGFTHGYFSSFSFSR